MFGTSWSIRRLVASSADNWELQHFTLFRYRESLVVLQRAKCNPGPELGSVFISSRYANSVVSTVTFGRCGQREAVTAPDPRSGEDTFDLIDDAVAALADRRLVWLGDDLRTIA